MWIFTGIRLYDRFDTHIPTPSWFKTALPIVTFSKLTSSIFPFLNEWIHQESLGFSFAFLIV
jgi:hypothetical protein